MKQIEKLDLLLKALYETRFEGYYPLSDICADRDFPIEPKTELKRLAKRLQSDTHIDTIYAQEECFAQITSNGILYCQTDSYAHKGHPILESSLGTH